MHFTKYIKTIIGAIVVLTLITIVSCATCPFCKKRSHISLENYLPILSADYSVYTGKNIYLMNFSNQAEDTSIWYYFSADDTISYGNSDLIKNFFWYAFHDMLFKIGMHVSNMDNPNLAAPAMWLTLLSITDEHFRAKVTLQQRGATAFMQIYEVTEPPLPKDKNVPVNLEKRAYKMTTKLFESILNDPKFRRFFF